MGSSAYGIEREDADDTIPFRAFSGVKLQPLPERAREIVDAIDDFARGEGLPREATRERVARGAQRPLAVCFRGEELLDREVIGRS